MSFNNLINRPNLTLQQDLISSIGSSQSSTIEQRDALESIALDVAAHKEMLLSKLERRDRFTQLNTEQEANQKAFFDLKIREIVLLEQRLLEISKDYYNKIEVKKLTLISKTNELRKKLSVISGLNNKAKFVIKEDFINLYNIDSTRNSTTPLSVDTSGEVATLPISNRSKVAINKILISKETNGIPGNYNSGKNKLIYNLIDENPDTCFEIFKRGSGPLRVKLIMDFSREEIINEIVIGRMNINGGNSFNIKSLVYTDIAGRSKNLESLIDKGSQLLKIDSYTPNDSLSIKHLPVKAFRASIVLESLEYVVSATEKIFSLGVKNLEFYLNSYQEKGELSSSVFQTPESLYAVSWSRKIFPSIRSSYRESFKVSLDKGGEYSDITEGFLPLDGKSKELIYNYKLERDASSIENVVNDVYFIEVDKQSRNINRNISPVSYALQDFNSKTLKVIQPKILSRKEEGITLGVVSNSGKNIIPLPYNLNKSNIKRSEIKLYMNNEAWVNKSSEAEVTEAGEFYVRENGKEIVVLLPGANSYVAKMGLKAARAEVQKRPEGYYCRINENFDYDKDEIKIVSLYGRSTRSTEFLPKEEKRFFLKEENIDPDSFELYVLSGQNWILVAEDQYELNSQDGILYYSENSDKERKCIYKYFKEKELKKNEYEIWAKNDQVNGLYFYDESIYVDEFEQKLKATSTRSYNSISKTYEERRDLGESGSCFILQHENIVKGSVNIDAELFGEDVLFKEVDYINGYTEFLNLEFMENDPVPNIEKNNLGQVSFTLLEIPYGEVKVFKKEEEVASTVTVNGRVCTITLLQTDAISKDYSVEYYYLGEEDSVKKYSVDYLNGVIYTQDDITAPEIKDVNYSVADVYLEYDIYKDITNFKVDNGVVVYTEEFLPINNKVKFLWFSKDSDFNIEGLEKYYSPIIYNLNIEMS